VLGATCELDTHCPFPKSRMLMKSVLDPHTAT
jgi:hypothetical protein